jgi:hypothetical protein
MAVRRLGWNLRSAPPLRGEAHQLSSRGESLSASVDPQRRIGLLARLRPAVFMAIAIAMLALPAAALAHSERHTDYPDPNLGSFPQYRTDGNYLVVCHPDTKQRIAEYDGALRKRNQDLLKKCRFVNIQAAVNRATNNTRILVMPGIYREWASLKPAPPGCEDIYAMVAAGNQVLTYDQERQCPNAKNLIAIMGDTNGNGICDAKCNIQIEGTGETPEDVVIAGDRYSRSNAMRLNGIRADRADGIYIKNLTTEFFDFNGMYFLETNGFRIDRVVSRWNREYGVLSFTSDHGIYEYCETVGNGDSGVYPGSGPNGRHGALMGGTTYGIIIRYCDSHDNLMGYSATAGNGTWSHHNKFHHNAAGTVTDAIVGGHPGMPPDFSKWTENLYYSNNKALFSDGPIPVPPEQYTDDMTTGRDEYCKRPPEQRDLKVVCPSFFMPIGTGLLLAGTNSDVVSNNYFFDNWRIGEALLYVPATLRGQDDPSRQADTSNNNVQTGNCMAFRPTSLDPAQVDFSTCSGTQDSNGVDFWWDEEEGTDCPEVDQDPGNCVDAQDNKGNCWSGNVGFGSALGGEPSSDPPLIQTYSCPGIDSPRPPNGSKSALLVPCTDWDPQTNTDPIGCEMAGSSWFEVPPEPQP